MASGNRLVHDGVAGSVYREPRVCLLPGVWRDFRVVPARYGRGDEVFPLRVRWSPCPRSRVSTPNALSTLVRTGFLRVTSATVRSPAETSSIRTSFNAERARHGDIDWKGRWGSITFAFTRSRAMTASIVAASTQSATCPRTRSSVQWNLGRSAKKSFITRKRRKAESSRLLNGRCRRTAARRPSLQPTRLQFIGTDVGGARLQVARLAIEAPIGAVAHRTGWAEAEEADQAQRVSTVVIGLG